MHFCDFEGFDSAVIEKTFEEIPKGITPQRFFHTSFSTSKITLTACSALPSAHFAAKEASQEIRSIQLPSNPESSIHQTHV